MKKLYLGACIASMSLVAACSSSSNEALKEAPIPSATIGVSIARNDNNSPFLQEMYQAFKTVAEKESVLHVMLESADNSMVKQQAQLDEMLAKGAKALVINLADPVNGGKVIIDKYCGKAPLVFYNFNPGAKEMAKCKDAYFVDSDVALAGIYQGLSVLENWKKNPQFDKNKDGRIQIAVLEAIPGEESSDARTKWSLSTIQSYPALSQEYQVLLRSPAFYQTQLAYDVVKQWVASPQFDNVELILSASDSMSMGATQAMKEYKKKTPIFSIDGLSVSKTLIDEGYIVSSVPFDSVSEAGAALHVAANLANNLEPLSGISHHMFDKVVRVPYATYESANLE